MPSYAGLISSSHTPYLVPFYMLLTILLLHFQTGTTDLQIHIQLCLVLLAKHSFGVFGLLALFASFAVKVPMVPVHIGYRTSSHSREKCCGDGSSCTSNLAQSTTNKANLGGVFKSAVCINPVPVVHHSKGDRLVRTMVAHGNPTATPTPGLLSLRLLVDCHRVESERK